MLIYKCTQINTRKLLYIILKKDRQEDGNVEIDFCYTVKKIL